eukprot:GSA25T00007222001.1
MLSSPLRAYASNGTGTGGPLVGGRPALNPQEDTRMAVDATGAGAQDTTTASSNSKLFDAPAPRLFSRAYHPLVWSTWSEHLFKPVEADARNDAVDAVDFANMLQNKAKSLQSLAQSYMMEKQSARQHNATGGAAGGTGATPLLENSSRGSGSRGEFLIDKRVGLQQGLLDEQAAGKANHWAPLSSSSETPDGAAVLFPNSVNEYLFESVKALPIRDPEQRAAMATKSSRDRYM